jgi:hypothetical protein
MDEVNSSFIRKDGFGGLSMMDYKNVKRLNNAAVSKPTREFH